MPVPTQATDVVKIDGVGESEFTSPEWRRCDARNDLACFATWTMGVHICCCKLLADLTTMATMRQVLLLLILFAPKSQHTALGRYGNVSVVWRFASPKVTNRNRNPNYPSPNSWVTLGLSSLRTIEQLPAMHYAAAL